MLQQYDTLKDVIYGALIIAVIVLMPGGIYGALSAAPARAHEFRAVRSA